MPQVFLANWALLVGIFLLLLGNGLQASLLGLRGPAAGFSTLEISAIMSAYFAGFLVSASVTPRLIRRVGHVRVFAALGSLISAVLILYPSIPHPLAWALLRALIGFCFCGVYITAESWLNSATTSANRGSALSAYMVVQMGGIVAAQGLLTLDDPSGFLLFIIPSVLVSVSFAPILLSVTPAPPFETTRNMSLGDLYRASPLGLVAMFLSGGIFSAQFGMAALYASEVGLSGGRLSAFLASFYVGAFALQMPIGWLSDRMDRRKLILVTAALGAGAAALGFASGGAYPALLLAGFAMGGLANPLYPLIIAYVNDAVDTESMAAASGGLLFVNGIGAILGPFALGALMGAVGPAGFWAFCAALLVAVAGFAAFRMAQRPPQVTGETVAFAPVFPAASPAVMETAGDLGEAAPSDHDPGGSGAGDGNREAA